MPDNLSSSEVDNVALKCLEFYKQLPKKGKPTLEEWTVLSCIVKHENNINEVVSLGTGSKCIGASKMSPEGNLLNDSHAEVFARRGFLLYLYENIRKVINNQQSIFIKTESKLKLKSNIEFIFYSSQLPCGDASIISKDGEEGHFGDVIQSGCKRKAEHTVDVENKRLKLDDIHRTGAKCLPNSEQDLKMPGKNYHVLGQVRTKPGRGDRTLSVSCSDKIARWIHLGIHGAFLDLIIEPIYIKHFIFGASVPYSEESLNRALLQRNPDIHFDVNSVPKFYQTSIPFSDVKTEQKFRAAAGSIVCIKLIKPVLEVAVHGRKLGLTKKNISHDSSLVISKYNIYNTFLKLMNSNKELKNLIFGEENIGDVPYNQMKLKSAFYRDRWMDVKDKFFKFWTLKPDMWNFTVKH